MILKSFELEQVKKSNLNFFLIYGENEGLKNEIIKNILINGFKNNIIRYDESEIIKKSDVLSAEVNNKSFFDDKKIIIISRATDKVNQLIESFIDKNYKDIRVVINAGLLDKKSKLRNLFEKKKNLACIPVYADNNLTLGKLAITFFKEKKIPISQETINLLVERCRGNRENLSNELNKIESFLKDKKKINSEELVILTNLAENYSYSELCDVCLAKNQKKTTHILSENNFHNEDCIAIIRILIYKTRRLIKLKEDFLIHNNYDAVIYKAKPPIFWKDKEIVKNQMQKWTLSSIKKFLYELNDLELLIKKNVDNSVNFVLDFILTSIKTNS